MVFSIGVNIIWFNYKLNYIINKIDCSLNIKRDKTDTYFNEFLIYLRTYSKNL